MWKKIAIVTMIVSLIGGGYYWWTKTPDSSTLNTQVAPTRAADITGQIVAVEGNEVIVAKEVGRVILTEAEQAVKKAEMQKLSEEQRKAAREAESAQYPTENVTLIIPVGVPIAQGTGDGSGQSKLVDLSALSKGTYVSIWMVSDGNVEYVKIKGL